MIRILAAAAAGLSLALVAGSAAAQTWGQPVYVTPYGGVVGGTPLSEVETRPYARTGRWAGGYTDQAWVYVPAPVHGARYSYGHDRRHGYHRGRYGSVYDHDRHARRARQGYRDVWGYNDDRHPSARGRSRDRQARYHDRDCGCGDVYLYDR